MLPTEQTIDQSGRIAIVTGANTGLGFFTARALARSVFIKRIVSPLMRLAFQSAEQGASSILYAATAADATPGGYYGPQGFNEMRGPVGPASIPSQATDTSVAERLWRVSEESVGLPYP